MSPHNILVADEDIDTRIILRTLLERQGYEVVEAGSAAAAMAEAQAAVSLVIMNYPMMVTPELTLAGWLRSQPHTRDVPIINLTSRAVPLLMDEAARQGVNVTLTKPLEVKRILNVVQELMPLVAS
jgi:CheY-like chemotaxis protein